MSEEDDLLERLGALEREHDHAFPHAWEDVVRGARTAEDVAAARREAGDDPAEVDALARSLRPLAAAERDAWVERLIAGQAGRPTASDVARSPEASDEAPTPAAAASVIPLAERRRTRGAWVTTAIGVLAAAALALWLAPRSDGPATPDGASTRPSFGLVVRNETVHDVRSGPHADEIARYRSDTQIHWVLRPERSTPGMRGVRVLVEAVDASATPARRLVAPAAASVSDRGVVELRGTLESLLSLPPGRWSLRFVIGASLPEDLAGLDRGGPWAVVEPPYVIDVVR